MKSPSHEPVEPANAAGGERRSIHRASGMVMIYGVMAMTAMIAIASLAVDVGQVQLAKTEMVGAVDAAARAAVAYLPTDSAGARSAAIALASQHTVAGSSLVLQTGDIEIGKWNSTTQSLDTGSSSPDAIRITAHRTVARGTPIVLSIAKVIGMERFNLTAVAVATTTGGTVSYGLVGLTEVTMSGSARTGTYDSTAGTFTNGVPSNEGSIASNSTISLSGSPSIGGTIYYYSGSAPSGGNDFDAKVKMTSQIATPATPSTGSHATSNSNASAGLPTTGASYSGGGGGTTTWPGGTYVVSSFSLGGSRTLEFSGPATIYVTGGFSAGGSSKLLAYQNKPDNLKIKMTSSSGFDVSGSADVYGVLEAPQSDVTVSGSGMFAGSVIAKKITLSGSGDLYYDKQLGGNSGSGSGGSSSLVK